MVILNYRGKINLFSVTTQIENYTTLIHKLNTVIKVTPGGYAIFFPVSFSTFFAYVISSVNQGARERSQRERVDYQQELK